jgi:hypothetical protein
MPHTFRVPFAGRIYSSLLPVAVFSLLTTAVQAQSPDTQQPAPIERAQPMQPAPATTLSRYTSYTTTLAVGQVLAPTNGTASAQPAAGIYLRVAPNSAVRAVSIDPQRAEFKVERGLVNLSVHDPAKDQLILIDLPGGQVQALKNGFYTFNAATDTTRVLKGEANAFVGANQDVKPIKVKEDHAVTFPTASAAVAKVRSAEFYPYEARTDIIPAPGDAARSTDGQRYGEGFQGYGYGYPGYGFYGYGYPYYAWDYPYPYYGYGYPFGFGLGFGYGWGGGFYGGGYGGGFHRR